MPLALGDVDMQVAGFPGTSGQSGQELRRRYFGNRVFDSGSGTVDYVVSAGEWIRLFRAHQLTVEALLELQAPNDLYRSVLVQLRSTELSDDDVRTQAAAMLL